VFLLTVENEYYAVAAQVQKRSNTIFRALLAQFQKIREKGTKISKIYLTGHSMGGALATAVYLKFLYSSQGNTLPCTPKVFTFNSPLVVQNTSKQAIRGEGQVINVIYQLDPIARILGHHSKILDLITPSAKHKDFKKILENLRAYHLYGKYYLVTGGSSNLEAKICELDNPSETLGRSLPLAAAKSYADHSMTKVHKAIRVLFDGRKRRRREF